MINYLLIGYLLGMVAYVLCVAEDARTDDDPEVQLMLSRPGGHALMALFAILLSPLWPWFALTGALGWLAIRLRATAARLREYADEDGR